VNPKYFVLIWHRSAHPKHPVETPRHVQIHLIAQDYCLDKRVDISAIPLES